MMQIDFKLKNIEIDFETADNIIKTSMLNQYHDIKEEIERRISGSRTNRPHGK